MSSLFISTDTSYHPYQRWDKSQLEDIESCTLIREYRSKLSGRCDRWIVEESNPIVLYWLLLLIHGRNSHFSLMSLHSQGQANLLYWANFNMFNQARSIINKQLTNHCTSLINICLLSETPASLLSVTRYARVWTPAPTTIQRQPPKMYHNRHVWRLSANL